MATDKKEAKLKAKREALKTLGTGFGSNEPVIDPNRYIPSLLNALNFYNASFDNKDKRKWFLSYVGKANAHKYDHVESDFEFRSVGTIIRLKLREQPLQQKELDFIESEIKRLANYTKSQNSNSVKPAKVVVKSPVSVVQDRVKEAASSHIAEFNAMFDEYFTNDIEPDFSAYLKANNVTPQVSKLIPASFNSLQEEIEELIEGKDKQLNEGYAHVKKTKAKKILKLIEDLKNACAQQVVAVKSARKPRARKEKPANIVAKNVKYMKSFSEYNITSVLPEKIIGASEVIVYNTKYKKLQVYRSTGMLGIKGTSIINYDVATSGSKTLRKPEQIKDFATMTKRTFASAFKSLTTKESAVNGRINEDCVILKVF